MAGTDLAELRLHIAAHRERAATARRLAAEFADIGACQGMLDHAEELERKAAAMEAEAATLLGAAANDDAPAAALAAPPVACDTADR